MNRVVRKMKSYFFRKVRFAWGRAWPLRSNLTSTKLKLDAQQFLSERQQDMLFVLGSGRSGTQLFSDLLGASGDAMVFHEPNFAEDVATMDELRRDQDLAKKYWQEFRGLEVYRRWQESSGTKIYSEVNGTIRYQTPAIQQLYPKAKMLLMVRDGRGVVRSVMGWKAFYGPRSKGAFALAPLPGDRYESQWEQMNRFEKMCWGWQDTNQFLMNYIPQTHWVQLEKATTNYDYFSEHFSSNAGIQISYETWLARVSQKSRNASKQYGFPAWDEWTDQQKEAYFRICGPTMEKLGYEI